jgi:signal transduction histidine kinase
VNSLRPPDGASGGPAPTPRRAPWILSLRWRLLAGTLVALTLALVLAGVFLSGLFRDHVLRQFEGVLSAQLDQVTARLDFDAAGQPVLDPQALSDPRWTRPYSGLYWQVDAMTGAARPAVLRSRSLWDSQLGVDDDALADGAIHRHEITGPGGAALLVVERTIRRDDAAQARWRVVVAGDLRETEAAAYRFNGVLLASLVVLLGLLCVAALVQVRLGLAPLGTLKDALARVREGRSQRLEGRFPQEVQALIDDFNGVLDRNAEVVARARTQAGNLAHAIKTPLAAMAQGAAQAPGPGQEPAALAALVREQVEVARRHVDWHLARSRAAAAQGLPGALVELDPVVPGLLRVMERVHAARGLDMTWEPTRSGLRFAGEVQDLQEMLGNLLDNACKWARSSVRVSASLAGDGPAQRLFLVVEDDGQGIEANRRATVVARGARLDESVPGSGLGLAIVQELAGLYGGSLTLGASALGGVRAELQLPGA